MDETLKALLEESQKAYNEAEGEDEISIPITLPNGIRARIRMKGTLTVIPASEKTDDAKE